MIVEGSSFEEVSAAYMSNLQEQFGDSVELGDEFKWEWITIPHIYNDPFYTYAYSFGQLLVLSCTSSTGMRARRSSPDT